jgi:hypothetical protein
MESDTFFWQLLKQLPETLFDLLNLPSSLASSYRFESVEMKKSYRLDGLLALRNATCRCTWLRCSFDR